MSKKWAKSVIVHKSANKLRDPSAADLVRLRRGIRRPVDTSDIPERIGAATRVVRSRTGRLPVPKRSAIREAILAELTRQGLTRYALFKAARRHCPTLSESAVYEFLRGHRQIGLEYIEALLQATGLVLIGDGSRKRATLAER